MGRAARPTDRQTYRPTAPAAPRKLGGEREPLVVNEVSSVEEEEPARAVLIANSQGRKGRKEGGVVPPLLHQTHIGAAPAAGSPQGLPSLLPLPSRRACLRQQLREGYCCCTVHCWPNYAELQWPPMRVQCSAVVIVMGCQQVKVHHTPYWWGRQEFKTSEVTLPKI